MKENFQTLSRDLQDFLVEPVFENAFDSHSIAKNWIINFPLNFLKKDRFLCVWHAVYGAFIFAEDKVLDDLSEDKDKNKKQRDHFLLCRCKYSEIMSKLSMNYIIPHRVYKNETLYYASLHWEKEVKHISFANYTDGSISEHFSNKILPLLSSYLIHCKKTRVSVDENVTNSVMNYHIAHQIYDDIIDLKTDIHRLDLSIFIKLMLTEINGFRIENIQRYKSEIENIALGVLNVAKKRLKIAKEMSSNFEFGLFNNQINLLSSQIEKKIAQLSYE